MQTKCNQFENFDCKWLKCFRSILDDCGVSYLWVTQEITNQKWLGQHIKQILKDQYMQKWKSDIENSPKSLCYRIYKKHIEFENYLDLLNDKDRKILCRFRTCNHRFPIETGRWVGVQREDRKCVLCNSGQIGDEFHYLLECKTFTQERKYFLGNYYCKHANILKFDELMNCKNVGKLRKICKFLNCIFLQVCPS